MFNKKFKEYDLFYSISEARLHNTQNIIVHCTNTRYYHCYAVGLPSVRVTLYNNLEGPKDG